MTGRPLAAALFALGLAQAAAAQTPPAAEPAPAVPPPTAAPTTPAVPAPVAVAPLAAPDLFAAAGAETGLPPTLWNGTSPDILRRVLPMLAARPLSPAGQALARRLLATGAAAPSGVGADLDLSGARIEALLAQGGLGEAREILAKSPAVDQRPGLAQAAAEAALLQGRTKDACAIGDSLATGRDGLYWLRLRAYCQASRGETDAAQLTLDLAQAQARDPVLGRLMAAKLAGRPPGPASLRGGLDYALSKDLGLDLSAAQPAPAVAAALNPRPAGWPVWKIEAGPGSVRATLAMLAGGDLATARTMRASLTDADIQAAGAFETALLDAGLAVATGQGLGAALDRLVERGAVEPPKLKAKAQLAAVFVAAVGAPLSDGARAQFAAFTAGETKAPPALAVSLQSAASEKRVGEVGLLALWTCAEAGTAGPAPGDRARIIRTLHAAGLEAEARAFVLEGLIAQR